MNLSVTKSGLGHSLEQTDPSPRHSNELSLIGHWKVLYLCQGIAVVSRSRCFSTWRSTQSASPASGTLDLRICLGCPSRRTGPTSAPKRNTHVNSTGTSKNLYIYKKQKQKQKKETKMRSYLCLPTGRLLAVEGRDHHGNPSPHSSTHRHRRSPCPTSYRTPRHSTGPDHLPSGTIPGSTLPSEALLMVVVAC